MLAVVLGTAESFAVLGGSTVTNTGPTVITGDLGVSPGAAVTGFPPGIVAPPGVIHAADAVAGQAQSDVTIAYNDLAGRPSNFNLTGIDLGGLTLVPGVYTFSTSAQLTGTVTLDAQGDPDAEFIFQMGSTITTASNSTVDVINGADGCNVYWQVGSSATIGTDTDFVGNILALTSITLTTNASILPGRALARNGAVTMDSNVISNDACVNRTGSIAWEKRGTDSNPVLLAGATFSISPNPLTGVGTLTVVDGGANDADGLANGVLQVNNVLPGTYTVTETVAPPGFAIDNDATRSVTVSAGNLNAVIGVQGVDNVGDTNESDFHNRLGSVAWEKRATDTNPVLLGGATFSISPDPTDGIGTLIVVDNGANDADPDAGQIVVMNARLGTYTITETIAPPGFAIDDDPTRLVTVSAGDLNTVIGVQGVDNVGDTNESDFHNRLGLVLGSIAWEKRATDTNPVLLAGATFVISPNPLTGAGTLIVVDGGANDADGLANGVVQVNNVLLGTYSITETVAPPGFAIDDDATRSITVNAGDLNAVIGTQGSNQAGNTDESDFHNRLGSIAWEKRATDANPVLLGGATFSISPDPTDGIGTLIVVDNGANDTDPLPGQIVVINVLLGTYSITEIVAPPGFAIDDDATRSVTVNVGDLNAVIGVQGVNNVGNTDESDFHNLNLLGVGSIAWEKRATDSNPVLLAGATFEISPNPQTGVGTLIVVDGGANDADGLANGVLRVNNVLLGTYTITETVAPPGFAIDDDVTRSITVSAGDLNAVVGVQGVDNVGDTDESDFHNRLGTIAWEKRTTDANPALLGGATFEISPDPTDGIGTLIVVDNGANDTDPDLGQIVVMNARLGTYTITETVAPPGFAIDDDATRSVTITAGELNVVIGVQGSNQAGNADESDFHNRLGTIAWEKRATDGNPVLLGGATFEISPDPTDGIGTLIVVDNGANDTDPDPGQIVVINARLGTYTITETVAPPGFAIDDDATRSVTITAGDLNVVIGVQGSNQAGDTDESDFHNRLGSIAWEKRTTDANPVLLAGATFLIARNPQTGVGALLVIDGGANDADGLANGVLQVNNVLLGTYTITEIIAPPGFLIDDDANRLVTVSAADLNAVVGTQGSNQAGDSNESDFHNRLGSLAWEKRATDANPVLLAGATFSISPNPLTGVGTLIVVDGGANDADGLANGVLQVDNVLLGIYTITETIAPPGFAIDDDATRSITVSAGDLNAVIGTQGSNQAGDTNESDFHNRLGSIAWEKRATDTNPVLLAAATFSISPDPTDGIGTIIVVDNGANDSDPDPGQITVINARLGTYTITETIAPTGFAIDDDATRSVTVSAADLNAVIGIQGSNQAGDTDESDFHNHKFRVIVLGMGKSPITPQFVQVLDEESGALLSQFAPYGNTFQGGVRVATGDLTGDGVDEIVTAPGWSIVAEVRVYTQTGGLLTSFRPYGSTFQGGVQVAVGDVDGDGLNDIITVPSFGAAEVKVFRNVLVGGVPTFNGSQPYRDFLAFPASFIGGGVVSVADMGSTPVANGPFDNTQRDQKAEIVIGSGAGMKTTVKVFDVSRLITPTPRTIAPATRIFTPFSTTTSSYQGGVSLSVARINADLIPDIVVGAGVNGRSMVDVWAWSNTASATLSSLSANGIGFAAFTDASRNSPVQVAALDTDGDDIADAILAVQGPGGTTGQIRSFNITSVSPLTVSPFTSVPGGFLGPFFVATIKNPSPALPLVAKKLTINQSLMAGEGEINVTPTSFEASRFDPPPMPLADSGRNTNLQNPLDANHDGEISPLDALVVINRLNSSASQLSEPFDSQAPFVDINNDGEISPLDALLIINWLNKQLVPFPQDSPHDQGEGEASTGASDAYFNQLGSLATALTSDYQCHGGRKWTRR